MATTTNYGWSTPDNTGYVKDGALAIRTLGTAVDASMAVLRGGTTGQVLQKASNSQMDIVWGTVSSTPRIGQVIQAITTTSTTTASTSYVDATDIQATITPTLSTSKVLVMINFKGATDGNFNTAPGAQYRLLRGATAVYDYGVHNFLTGITTTVGVNGFKCALMYVDSPATTSATTYKLQLQRTGSGTSATAGGSDTSIILQEVLV